MTRLLLLFVLSMFQMAAASAVLAQNTPPTAVNDTTTVEDGVLATLDVLANDTDDDDDPLTIVDLPVTPAKGEAIIFTTEDGQFIQYRSNPNASGVDTFTYRISDGAGGEDTALVYVTIIHNDPPTPKADTTAVFAHEVVDIDVLANDTDPDGDTITITDIPSSPQHGTAQIVTATAGQRIRYNPDDTYEGRDSLRYEVADSLGHTAVATVRIDVILNRRPVAMDDSLTIIVDTTVVINVLANDTDAEGDPLVIQGIAVQPAHGRVELIDDRTRVQYTPTPGYLGEDRFTYIVSDGVPRDAATGSDRGTVVIQVLPPDDSFEAVLSGATVVPAFETRASGLVRATLDGTTLAFSGLFSGLEADALEDNSAHLHIGSAGRNGDVLLPLNTTLNPNRRSGSLARDDNTFTLTTDAVAALFERRLYVTVSTASGEELRGQLLPVGSDDAARGVFSGRAVIPATSSRAIGGVAAERFGNTLTVTGSFSGLASPLIQTGGSVQLHQGIIGGNGAVLFDLQVTPDADRRGGLLEQQNNQFTLTPEQGQLFDEGLTYLVVRTQNAQGGEIRGQLLPFSQRVFEVALAGDNEIPVVASSGAGGLLATIDGPTLALSGTFDGLTSDVDLTLRNGAHIHQAPPDANGAIIYELVPLLATSRRSGSFVNGSNRFTLATDQLAALYEGNLYVNIHTDDHPGGELRGQLLPSPNVAPASTSIASPADGASEDLSGDASNPFAVTWPAAADPNGNTVYYRWQLARDATFNTPVFTSDPTVETTWTTTFGALNGTLEADGVALNESVTLYHRVVTTDGGMATSGPAVQITLRRGVATALEEADAVPTHFAVEGNYPNPFNPVTTVRLALPVAARVQVEVYDVLGRRVLTTPLQALAAGAHRSVQVDARTLASGMYLYRVVARTETRTFTGTGPMTVLK